LYIRPTQLAKWIARLDLAWSAESRWWPLAQRVRMAARTPTGRIANTTKNAGGEAIEF
jgi:hypothetical protein